MCRKKGACSKDRLDHERASRSHARPRPHCCCVGQASSKKRNCWDHQALHELESSELMSSSGLSLLWQNAQPIHSKESLEEMMPGILDALCTVKPTAEPAVDQQSTPIARISDNLFVPLRFILSGECLIARQQVFISRQPPVFPTRKGEKSMEVKILSLDSGIHSPTFTPADDQNTKSYYKVPSILSTCAYYLPGGGGGEIG